MTASNMCSNFVISGVVPLNIEVQYPSGEEQYKSTHGHTQLFKHKDPPSLNPTPPHSHRDLTRNAEQLYIRKTERM